MTSQEPTYDVTFEVYCAREEQTVLSGICNGRPLTLQEALTMFRLIPTSRDLWPDALLTLEEWQTPEFNYTTAGSQNSQAARLNGLMKVEAPERGAPRNYKGPSLPEFLSRRSRR